MIKKYICLLFLPLLFSCVTQETVLRAELIAHAGGEIDGNVYTNSFEALEQAVSRGYKYIELDLLLTSDSVLVAAHSWEEFNNITGYGQWGDSVPTAAQFAESRIHNRYTPLTAQMINDFFSKHDSLYLVTDKVSDPTTLARNFPGLKQRMVVEAFSYAHYSQLLDEGYYRVLYSCMANDLGSALTKNLLFHRLFPGRRIEWVALHTNGLSNGMFKFLNKVRRFNVALFTVDNYDDIQPAYRQRAKMIYTNTLQPE